MCDCICTYCTQRYNTCTHIHTCIYHIHTCIYHPSLPIRPTAGILSLLSKIPYQDYHTTPYHHHPNHSIPPYYTVIHTIPYHHHTIPSRPIIITSMRLYVSVLDGSPTAPTQSALRSLTHASAFPCVHPCEKIICSTAFMQQNYFNVCVYENVCMHKNI